MKTFIVDSFTDVPFKGNPAGVCLIDHDLSDEQMQLIAFELGLSETAFVRTADLGQGLSEDRSLPIRFFSPKQEIPLCGHATLAAARAFFEYASTERVRFHTRHDVDLEVRRVGERLQMQLPRYGTTPATAPAPLMATLGLETVTDAGYNEELEILLLEIEDTDELARLSPDFEALVKAHDSIAGVLVTARSNGDDFDFHSRYFWPWSGTNEDPVTGGTHTFLAPWWSEKMGRSRFRSFQSSERTGSMEVEVLEDAVLVRADAVIVLEGSLRIDIDGSDAGERS